METLIDTPELKISFEQGTIRETVVAFAGIGHGLGGIAREEFARTLRSSEMERDTYFVIDKHRMWYNTTASQIVDIIGPRLAGRRVITLGNSMGGFGAILLSGLLPICAVAIAFAPQFSVEPTVASFETRWRDYVDRIVEWTFPTCVRSSPHGCRTHIIIGADDSADVAHAKLLREALGSGAAIWAVGGCGHDVAAYLKERGVLRATIEAASGSEASSSAVASVLSEASVSLASLDPPQRHAAPRALSGLS